MSINEDIYDRFESDQFMFSNNSIKRIEHLKFISNLPPQVMKRVHALRKLQIETANLEAEFHREIFKLQHHYEDLHRETFEKRKAIVNGEYNPSEEECEISIPILSSKIEQNLNETKTFENIPAKYSYTTKELSIIPDFWLIILKYSMESLVKKQDEPALKHLKDIRSYSKTEPELSYVLEFEFATNEFFTNKVLRKEYFLKCLPDPEDPFSFDGPEIKNCTGCDIHWYPGKDLTKKTVKEKGSLFETVIKVESFFNFFSPPEPIDDENDPLFEDVNVILEADYEVANYIRERIVPMAVLFYTGEINEGSEVSSTSSGTPKDFESEELLDDYQICAPEGEGDAA